MRINEIDWKHSSLKRILGAISESLKDVEREYGTDNVDEILEQWDELLGTAMVAAQAYITGTVNDANKLSSSELGQQFLLTTYSDLIPRTSIKKMELCDALANYFKHHDEWPDWTPNPIGSFKERQSKKTNDCLAGVGISEATEYRCVVGLRALLGSSSTDLDDLFSVIVEWRKKVIAAYK